MKKCLVIILGILCGMDLFGQQLHFQVFYAPMRPNYNTTLFDNIRNGGVWGGKFALGTNRIQLGIESENAFSVPSILGEIPDTSYQIDNTFIGGFIRANFSSIPAYRLGVVTKIGIGYFEDKGTQEIVNQENFTFSYPDKILGFNAGIGLSGPIKKQFHWEFMYQLSFHQRPEIVMEDLIIPKHNAWQNAFQFGISMNFIWGKAKREAEAMISGRGW